MKDKTILIVDDTIQNLEILSGLLDKYDILEATSAGDALEIIDEEEIDLILLDIMMPEMDGYDLCKKLKGNHNTKDIPIIFITAMTDEDTIEKAYDVGGSDYIAKPFKSKELLARVKMQFKIQDLQNDLKLMASTDSMTNLYNRRYFTKISEHIFAIAKRDNEDLFIIMLDIDNFKSINDTYGHIAGDETIMKLAGVLNKNCRKSDITCRYGGDEFIILLPNTGIEGARNVAEKIRQNIESMDNKFNNKTLKFTVSIGISKVDAHKDESMEKALKTADQALYKSKESGKNKITIL